MYLDSFLQFLTPNGGLGPLFRGNQGLGEILQFGQMWGTFKFCADDATKQFERTGTFPGSSLVSLRWVMRHCPDMQFGSHLLQIRAL